MPKIEDMITSKLTSRSQTTLPPAVRKVLGLKSGSRIAYQIEGREVRLINVETLEHEDPALEAFLVLLGESIATPGEVRTLSSELLRSGIAATAGEPIDHEAPMPGDTAL